MSDNDQKNPTAEPGVYHLAGQLYYRHEDGKVFSASLSHISRAWSDEDPFVFSFAEDVPEDAEIYAPQEGSTRQVRMDDWTDACDMHANPMKAEVWAKALAVAHSESAAA